MNSESEKLLRALALMKYADKLAEFDEVAALKIYDRVNVMLHYLYEGSLATICKEQNKEFEKNRKTAYTPDPRNKEPVGYNCR